MTINAAYGSLRFEEAIDYLRQKVNVPTAVYGDMLEGAHTRAFTVAGATKDGMLVDFRAAVDQAIADGTTLETFRKSFDDIVAKYGWDYNGGRNWRSRVIYETNMRTAHSAGRYSQMTDPDVLRYRPFWKYRHKDGEKYPRPEHEAWDGLVLLASDPWWKTHYGPNGWGCQCDAVPLSRRDLAAEGKSGPDQAPPVDARMVTVNTSNGPVNVSTPKGIDPGWGYSVGEAAYGKPLSDIAMKAWKDSGAEQWESMTDGDWRTAGRPKDIPIDRFTGAVPPPAETKLQLRTAISRAIGGAEKAFTSPIGDPVLINAETLADHMEPARASFAPLLAGLIADPFEIWLSFERHKGTGRVVLRQRFIKYIEAAKARGYVLVAQSVNGAMEAYTLVPVRDGAYVQRQRRGRLIYARPEDATPGDAANVGK